MPPAVIRTYSGHELNPLDVSIDHIRIEDIAHSLSLCNRFCGHTKEPISVAQHSIYVSQLVCSSLRQDRKIILQGLLHDASEAYLGDVTKWLKETPEFASYREAEDRLQRQIFVSFGLPEELHPLVEWADRVMVRFEGLQGFGPNFKIDHPNYPALTIDELDTIGPWSFWSWKRAEDEFLRQFYEWF